MLTSEFVLIIFAISLGLNAPLKGLTKMIRRRLPAATASLAVGFVMGGTQSLSRSTYSKLMPETKDTASFFSFYDVTEKIAIVIGMFSFAWITEITGSQRNSVLTLISFFILGLLLIFLAFKKQKSLSR